VHHRAAARLRNHPLAAGVFRKLDGLHRAEPDANAASLAGNGVDHETGRISGRAVCRAETAVFCAPAAGDAVLLPDHGHVSAAEFMALPDLRIEDEMEVRGIHVAVGDNGAVRQASERGGEAGLAGPSLSAQDDDFLHRHGSNPPYPLPAREFLSSGFDITAPWISLDPEFLPGAL